MRENTLRNLRTFVVYAILVSLLWWSLRAVPLVDIWDVLKELHLWQIGILFLLNVVVLIAMNTRWWIIVRVENPQIQFWQLMQYRLAVFGISYFTPGPQVGGEPFQVIYLQKNHGITFARATSAVIMDKLLEFLANFILLAIGLAAAARVGLVYRNGIQATGWLILLVTILLWPLIHLALLYWGRYPVSSVLRAVMPQFRKQKWMRLVIVSERMAGAFTHNHPGALFAALGFSLLSWAGMAVEYYVMAGFLQAQLNAEQALVALTAARLAFLMPLPGGLGALEASQVYVMTTFGYPVAIGVGISLLMRARDILNGGLGIWLAGKGFSMDEQDER